MPYVYEYGGGIALYIYMFMNNTMWNVKEMYVMPYNHVMKNLNIKWSRVWQNKRLSPWDDNLMSLYLKNVTEGNAIGPLIWRTGKWLAFDACLGGLISNEMT